MSDQPDYLRVLAEYPSHCRPSRVEFLGSAGGFSGAMFWKLETPSGHLCLRRWPSEHPNVEQLDFVHAVLRHVWRDGFHLLPLPMETARHTSFVSSEGHLWELTPWLSGVADYRAAPSKAKLQAAMVALAEFHRHAASFPRTGPRSAVSPGLSQRVDSLRELLVGGLDELAGAIVPERWPELARLGRQLLELFPPAAKNILPRLIDAARQEVPLQPCICDIWHAHVLFQESEVSGIVDFGAMRPETVAADVTRLLGSLVGDDWLGWKQGLAAYESVRPLSDAERPLIRVLDETVVLMGGLKWIAWVYEEGRDFQNRAAVEKRVAEGVSRLARLRTIRP
ncbi:MAG: phosphotransferase enzyme family protein [Pirellulales bacterium]